VRSRRLTPRRRECARLEQNPARGRGHLEHLLPKPLKCNAWSSRCNALRRRSRWRTLLKGGAGLSAQRRPSAVSSWKHRQPIASLGNPANVLLSPASLSRHHVALAKPNLRFLQANSLLFLRIDPCRQCHGRRHRPEPTIVQAVSADREGTPLPSIGTMRWRFAEGLPGQLWPNL
jgi:hypothetical protein